MFSSSRLFPNVPYSPHKTGQTVLLNTRIEVKSAHMSGIHALQTLSLFSSSSFEINPGLNSRDMSYISLSIEILLVIAPLVHNLTWLTNIGGIVASKMKVRWTTRTRKIHWQVQSISIIEYSEEHAWTSTPALHVFPSDDLLPVVGFSTHLEFQQCLSQDYKGDAASIKDFRLWSHIPTIKVRPFMNSLHDVMDRIPIDWQYRI